MITYSVRSRKMTIRQIQALFMESNEYRWDQNAFYEAFCLDLILTKNAMSSVVMLVTRGFGCPL